jgi:hypothetical protein
VNSVRAAQPFSGRLTFAEIKSKFPNPPADRTLRDDFQHLKRLRLVQVSGIGRGAKWSLISTN